MDDHTVLTLFPKTHVKAFDGMSVTAEVWSQAHGEHRQALRAHDLVLHGSGIICGLEVTANDPPNQYVYISPGAAINPAGNLIVLTEIVAYDFGPKVEGSLYLVLGHGERESGGAEAEVKYTHDEFVIAARPSLPKRPVVELARVNLSEGGKPIHNAREASHPHSGELDLRFRVQLESRAIRPVQVGVISLGKELTEVLSGWDHLSRECLRSNFYKLIVDTGLSLASDLSHFDLICLSANGAFNPEAVAVKALQAYLSTGKPVLIEALDPAAESAFSLLFEKLGLGLQPLPTDDHLLNTPYLFATPPGGQTWRDKQVIYVTGGFSPAWSGKNALARAEIRSAHEWGLNLLHACLNRSG